MFTLPSDPQHPYRDRIEVLLWGELPECARGWAVDEVEQAVTHEGIPLVHARVTLRRPTRAAGLCQADVAVDLDGHLIHGRAEEAVPRAALHVAASRVHAQAAVLGRRYRAGQSLEAGRSGS